MGAPFEETSPQRTIVKDFIDRYFNGNQNKAPDEADEIARRSLEQEQARRHDMQLALLEELERKARAKLKRYNQDTRHRETYAGRVYWFMVGYTLFMAVVVLLSGLPPSARLLGFPIALDVADVPLTTLIGSAFASAVGLVHFVIKGLFPLNQETEEAAAALRDLIDRDDPALKR